MAKKDHSNLRLVFLLLVILMISCTNGCALASPQKLRPSSGWRRKMVRVNPSLSGRGGTGGGKRGPRIEPLPLFQPPPPLVSPPPSPSSKLPASSSKQLPLP
ncbi:unnamed protein product [Microthlaspi erraticum]|uniref:Uncharacterized protein n=1 Tax=Microthlaspi erraticum TaxID=1685480 RepID=A0A6D2JK06_9BRAS|nr:unnamed protein product [Microthlaspi erraticum]CAA7051224.1 unnamed protein product [Microthlaspi erraticum]